MFKKIVRAVAVVLVALILVTSPVLAMSNPDAIAFYAVGLTPIYKVFYNVMETGDRLFVAEQYVHYVVSPNESASEAFLFEVLNTAGNETIASTPLKQYEAKPISIYMSATQVTTASATNNVSVGSALIIRITGNPLIFPSTTNNTVASTLNSGDYVDQTLGDDGGVATDNLLRNFLIEMADDIETFDSPPVGSEYIDTVQGVRYLTAAGGDIFLEGIPNLSAMCPILFQASASLLESDEPTAMGTYANTLAPVLKWGATTANGLTNLGVFLGINQAMAGSLMLFVLVGGFAIYVYTRTQSGVATLLLVATTPFLGAFLGLMPIALAFVFVMFVVVLLGFFFFTRGAL